ncbi:MAG TPA: tetratricopeptide repeat protein, partial [Spirochaetales bacterium]|nr:tetratricopeptide repeat protein [Spirochaetales bacterium]
RAMLAEAGKYDESIAMSDRYLDSDPDNAAVLAVKAYALHRQGRDDEAIAVYERVASLNGGDRASSFNLAVLLEATGRGDEAMARYDAMLALDPDDAAASYRKGLLLAGGGDAEAAIPFLERYLAAEPESAEGRRVLAAALERAGLYLRALEAYAAMAAKDETDAAAWFALARLRLTKADDATGGLSALDSAIEQGFKDAEAARALLRTDGLLAADLVEKRLGRVGLLDGERADGASADGVSADGASDGAPKDEGAGASGS